jgi:Putative Actinobacterial Holin-X, holin superfamily III
MSGLGLSGATKRVADSARSFIDLELQLAIAELKKKAQALGAGVGLMAGAAILAFLALTFALLAAAAGLATTMAVWEALLIVCGALIVVTAILVWIGYVLLQKATQPMPEQAVEEARLTAEALRNGEEPDGE